MAPVLLGEARTDTAETHLRTPLQPGETTGQRSDLPGQPEGAGAAPNRSQRVLNAVCFALSS